MSNALTRTSNRQHAIEAVQIHAGKPGLVDNSQPQPTPYDDAAERAVLGSCLIDEQAAQLAFDTLQPHHFYGPQNRFLFGEFLRIFTRTHRLDEIVVCHEIKVRDENRKKRGMDGIRDLQALKDFIGRLMLDTPSAAGVENYCAIVLKMWKLRELAEAALSIQKGVAAGTDPDTLAIQVREVLAPETQPESKASVFDQVAEEMAGRRVNIPWPECPRLSSTLCFLPGAITVLCGSGGTSKSFFIGELIWRLVFAGIDACVLEMEENIVFHLRRMVAQWAQWNDYLDPRKMVLPENVERAAAMKAEHAANEQLFRENGHVQTMNRPKTVQNVLAWIDAECRRGRKVLCIDSISSMQDEYGKQQERLLDEGKQIVVAHDARLVLVCHPKKSDKPKPVPVVGDIMGAVGFERFVSTIFWLSAHKPEEGLFSDVDAFGENLPDGQGLFPAADQRRKATFNRSCWILKSRLNKFIGSRIAIFNNGGNLSHQEIGWV